MLHSLVSQIALFAMFASCGFAFWKGSVVERWVAGIICVSWSISACLSLILAGLFSPHIEEFTFLAVDAATAVGLLVLALRFTKIWLGIAMLMQSGELALHGAVMADWGLTFRQYLYGNNIISFCLLLLLVGATVVSWMKRRADLKAAALRSN